MFDGYCRAFWKIFKIIMELPKSILAIIDLLKKTRGRDKVIRLLQYTFRFLTELVQKPAFNSHFRSKEARTDLVESFRNVANGAASTRKLFRFTKHLDIFLRVRKYCDILARKIPEAERKPEVYYLMKIGSDAALFLYYILDHFLYFYFLGALAKGKMYGPIAWYSDFCWLVESILDVLTAAVDAVYHNRAGRFEALKKSLLEVLLYIIDALVA